MKLKTAKKLINASKKSKRQSGYRIGFEKRERGFLTGDYFPELDEPPILTKKVADDLAKEFAKSDKDKYVNVHICHSTNFSPVDGYDFYNRYSPGRGYFS